MEKIRILHPPPLPMKGLCFSALQQDKKKALQGLNLLRKTFALFPCKKAIKCIFAIEEARYSLEFQQVIPSLEKCYLYLYLQKEGNPLMRPVANYLSALQYMQKTPPKRLSIAYLERLHALIEKDSTISPSDIGHIRTRQNWIGPENCSLEEAYFIPPPAETVPTSLQNALQYFAFEAKDPLIRLPLFFSYFLLIHPFMDANGRIARLLIPLFLTKAKLLQAGPLTLSRYFFKNRKRYLNKLLFVSTKKQWEEWILFFLRGIEEQCTYQVAVIHALQRLYEKLLATVSCKNQKKLLFFLMENPVFTLGTFREKFTDLETKQALQMLCKKKIVVMKKKNNKTIYVFSAFFQKIKNPAL